MQHFVKKYGLAIIVLFHLIGLLGMLVFNTRLFASLSTLNLAITAAVVILAHRGAWRNLVGFFLVSFCLGFGVELLGTHTGIPFGEYSYGQSLAPLLWDVPVIIGVNWFLLAMAAAFFTRRFIASARWCIPAAAVAMVALDFLIEQVAPALGYWYWKDHQVPWMNYLGWLGVAFPLQFLLQIWLGTHQNKVAGGYFVVVFLFFVILNFKV